MDTNNKLNELESRIELLENRSRTRDYYRERIVTGVLNIARLKTSRDYIDEKGHIAHISYNDVDRYVEYFQNEIIHTAIQWLTDETAELK